MIEAANTTASTAAIWAIVIVAVSVLAFWLTAVILADRSQVRASGRSRITGVLSGAWTGGSVAGAQAPEIPGEAAHEPIVVQETGTRGGPGGDEAVPPGEVPTRTDIPAQRTEGGQRAMPRQRAGDADRAARSYTARDTPDDEEPGR